MKRVVLIDSGPLWDIVNPRAELRVKEWLRFLNENEIALRVAEISDYETRRELLLQEIVKAKGVEESQIIKNKINNLNNNQK